MAAAGGQANVSFVDCNKGFMKGGSINKDLMPDALHPNPAGARAAGHCCCGYQTIHEGAQASLHRGKHMSIVARHQTLVPCRHGRSGKVLQGCHAEGRPAAKEAAGMQASVTPPPPDCLRISRIRLYCVWDQLRRIGNRNACCHSMKPNPLCFSKSLPSTLAAFHTIWPPFPGPKGASGTSSQPRHFELAMSPGVSSW